MNDIKVIKINGLGRIKKGTLIFQDFGCSTWPECSPPESEYSGEEYQCRAKNPDMIFNIHWDGGRWECRADGYGRSDFKQKNEEYGCGSIFVRELEGVEVIKLIGLTNPDRLMKGGE